MKTSQRTVNAFLALAAISAFAAVQCIFAADLNPQQEAQKIVRQDTGLKGQIRAAKQKIAEEREAILAAGRRLTQVRKTGDKTAIEQAKKETDAEIKERKSAISVLKTEIERLQGSAESFAPKSKQALDR